MKTTKQKTVLLLVFLVVATIMFVLFYSKSYYPPLPIEGISKQEVVGLLSNKKKELIKLKDAGEYSWYGFNGNQLDGGKALINDMKTRDLLFVEQMGSGYIFKDSLNVRIIATSQMWTSNYVIFKVQR